MINFRYHIVSLTAVFLALIIGILMGTTVVSKATVDGLRSNLRRAEARSSAVHQTNKRLSQDYSDRRDVDTKVDAALSARALNRTADGLLDTVPVLIIASKGEDKDVLGHVTTALDSAGADVAGTLLVDDSLSPEKLDTGQLAKVLGVDPSGNVRATLTTRVAATLARAALVPESDIPGTGPTTTTTTTSRVDGTVDTATTTTTTTVPSRNEPGLLDKLTANGYLDFQPQPGRPENKPILWSPRMDNGIGYQYVVVSGADPPVPNGAFLDPVIAKVARIGSVPLVAGSAPTDEKGTDRDAFLGPLLKIDGVSGQISTVDDLDSYAGQVALAFGLHEAGAGHFGNYGVGATASTVLPSLTG